MTIPVAIRKLILVLLILISVDTNAQNSKAEILWDHYGIPHIYAKSTAAMYYALGWAQMHNHADLLLRLYGEARAKGSEYWGEDHVALDKKMLLFNIPDRAKKMYDHQDPEFKSYYDAFVNGINAFAKAYPRSIAKEYSQVLPVTVYDVTAHMIRVPFLEFLAARDIATGYQMIDGGSNSIAIAPSRSASGNALLLANPHTPWSDLFTWFESDLNAPGLHAYGAALVGMPSLGIGFNENLGWTHTNNTIDASDIYELTIKDGGYVMDSVVVPFEKKSVFFKVRMKDGSLQEREIVIKSSKHGPIISEDDKKAYSIRIAGIDNRFLFMQYHKMVQAKKLTEFEEAVKMLQQPFFNIVYADRDGNIMYLFNGNVPKRSEGNWGFWRGSINGTQSKYIWKDIHSYEDLPKLINPSTGFVQNANDPPWTCTFPMMLDPAKFPAYMSPRSTDFRPQRALKMLSSDSSVSFDELVAFKMNTTVETANRFLDDLLHAVDQYPDSIAVKAAAILKNWDRCTDSGSRGAILYMYWFGKLKPAMISRPWTVQDPLATPTGLKDPKNAVALLTEAAKDVQNKFGNMDLAWGQVNRFRMGKGIDLAGNGGEGVAGVYRVIRFVDDGNNKAKAIFGDSYVSVIEFGKKIKAQGLLSYGNASQEGNKHKGDQLFLLSQKRLRPVLFYREDVLKNVEAREILN
jgi:acyl-homoserine-lactone acylase